MVWIGDQERNKVLQKNIEDKWLDRITNEDFLIELENRKHWGRI